MAIQFQILMGKEARAIDPDKIEWPDDTIVVYAREGEKIVGRSTIMQIPHIEGTWVDEQHRRSTLAPRLVAKVESIMKQANKKASFAFIQNSQPEVAGYMERIGYARMPLEVFSKELT